MARKHDFGERVRAKVTEFDTLVTQLQELSDIFIASGYDSGGSNEIVDIDLQGLDMTAQDLANFHTFITQLQLFLNAGDPTVFDYASAIDAFRNMP